LPSVTISTHLSLVHGITRFTGNLKRRKVCSKQDNLDRGEEH
jgi:hypothetical protein